MSTGRSSVEFNTPWSNVESLDLQRSVLTSRPHLGGTVLRRVLDMQTRGQRALVVGGSKGVGLAVSLHRLTFGLEYRSMNNTSIETFRLNRGL